MDRATVRIYEGSLRRCIAQAGFLTRFYETFMASSPEVALKFARTDLEKQRSEVRASLFLMVLVAMDEGGGPARHLWQVAELHGKRNLDVGARLYDLWLDSLLATVRQFDPGFSPEVEKSWEAVMTIGIRYMVSRYSNGGPPAP
ncbi:MAG TPA: globin [Candidatus Polarisedimenticolia bacterium]|jgi:hemoglobin-like flavoprotein